MMIVHKGNVLVVPPYLDVLKMFTVVSVELSHQVAYGKVTGNMGVRTGPDSVYGTGWDIPFSKL